MIDRLRIRFDVRSFYSGRRAKKSAILGSVVDMNLKNYARELIFRDPTRENDFFPRRKTLMPTERTRVRLRKRMHTPYDFYINRPKKFS